MDGGSSINILYIKTLHRMKLHESQLSYSSVTQLALMSLNAVECLDVEDVNVAPTIHECFRELIAINKRINDQRVLSPTMCFPWAI